MSAPRCARSKINYYLSVYNVKCARAAFSAQLKRLTTRDQYFGGSTEQIESDPRWLNRSQQKKKLPERKWNIFRWRQAKTINKQAISRLGNAWSDVSHSIFIELGALSHSSSLAWLIGGHQRSRKRVIRDFRHLSCLQRFLLAPSSSSKVKELPSSKWNGLRILERSEIDCEVNKSLWHSRQRKLTEVACENRKLFSHWLRLFGFFIF